MTMELESGNHEESCIFARLWLWLKGFPSNLREKMFNIARHTKKIALDDPRRVIHSLKVGVALTFVSLFYYFQPLYSNFGVSTMWAVMTVVVVFEFSVGATLGKGLNRGLATLVAGALGLGAHHLAIISGTTGQPILIGIFVFLQAVAATFARFFPKVKARYDYGILIFMITFCLVSISGLQTNEVLDLAYKRLFTVLIGAATCVLISIFIFPVWAGEDLHKLVSKNLDKLGDVLEGFADDFHRPSDAASKNCKINEEILNQVLDAKNNEETLANFARWEPGHGAFIYSHPWKQYLKIGKLTRQCARHVEALNGYTKATPQAPHAIHAIFQDAFSKLSSESGKALKELACAIKTTTVPYYPNPNISNLKMTSENLKLLLKSDVLGGSNLLQVIPVATIASLLINIVISMENIAEAVNELALLAKFKSVDPSGVEGELTKKKCGTVEEIPKDEIPHVIYIGGLLALANKEGQCQDLQK